MASLAFPINTRVRLKFSPDAEETGTVTGDTGGKVIVHWPDWNREGKYFACSLITAEGRRERKGEEAKPGQTQAQLLGLFPS